MASNGLVANAKKTIFMILNLNKKYCESKIAKNIQVGGETVPRSSSTKLLGVNIDDKHNWREHFSALQANLNKRTFNIRRIANQIPKKVVMKVVIIDLDVQTEIWTSALQPSQNPCRRSYKHPDETYSSNTE